jgi:hypothetical protein
MNALHDLMLRLSYPVVRRRVCCDCQLPNWLGKYYFDGNCMCECHTREVYQRGEVTLRQWQAWTIVWRRTITRGADPTEIVSLIVRHDNKAWFSITTFWDTLSVSVRTVRANRSELSRGRLPKTMHRWSPNYFAARQNLISRTVEAIALAMLDRATRAANPPLTAADRYAREMDDQFYGGE